MADIAMFKIEGGRAKALDAKGHFFKTVGDSGVKDERVQSDSIIISYENGKTNLYDKQGHFKKTL